MSRVKSTYYEKLRDPRWQRKRLEMFQRADFHCECCFDGENKLNLHHRYYVKDREPWDYPDWAYVVTCDDCHNMEHEDPSLHTDWEKLAGSILEMAINFEPIRQDILKLIGALSGHGYTSKQFAELLAYSLLTEWKHLNPGSKPPTGWIE